MVGSEEPWNFTQVGPGTPAKVWRRHTDWGQGEPLSLEGISRLVVVAAHPDDETLGAGGLIASAVRSRPYGRHRVRHRRRAQPPLLADAHARGAGPDPGRGGPAGREVLGR